MKRDPAVPTQSLESTSPMSALAAATMAPGGLASLTPALMRFVLAHSTSCITIADVRLPEQPIVYANEAFLDISGYGADEIVGRNCRFLQGSFVGECERQRDAMRRAIAHGERVTVTLLNVRKSGEPFWNEITLIPYFDDAGQVAYVLGFQRDISERLKRRRILEQIRGMLEMIASGRGLPHVLESLCNTLSEASRDAYCALMLYESTSHELRLAAAPQLPRALAAAIRTVPVAKGQGSCGSAAAIGDTVICEDVATDADCKLLRTALLDHQVRACWSIPFYRPDGRLAGTFAVFLPRVQRPSHDDLELATRLAHLAGIAVEQSDHAREVDHGRRRLRAIFNNAGAGLAAFDRQGRLISINPVGCRLLDCEAHEVVGRSCAHLLQHAFDADGEHLGAQHDLVARCMRSPEGRADLIVSVSEANADRRWLSITAVMSEGAAGDLPETVICSVTDISDIKRAQDRLQRLAHYDDLTSLPNRAWFVEAAQRALAEARAMPEARVGLLAIDLDGFKHVNDTFGHETGDRLLRMVAERLSACVESPNVLARKNGDEFVVLLPRLAGEDVLAAVAACIHASLQAPFIVNGREIFIGAAVGASCSPEHGLDYDALFRHADVAMYSAKRSGRNRYALFRARPPAFAADRLRLDAELHHALSDHEFMIAYQPRVRITDGRVIGAEALLRWRHPERGLVGPTDFIDLAEDTGLIHSIGDWVVEQVCKQLAQWTAERATDACVSFNVSPRQFSVERFDRVIIEMAERHRCPLDRLQIEITESSILDASDQHNIQALERLRAQGVQVLLDDFGTGYSSLAYLQRFKVGGFKIDRSFVARLPDDPASCAITHSLLALADTLQLHVTAEGVESNEQRDWLHRHGCREAQGFMYGAALSAEEFEALLRARR